MTDVWGCEPEISCCRLSFSTSSCGDDGGGEGVVVAIGGGDKIRDS